MERSINVEERIKRAEQIYNKRHNVKDEIKRTPVISKSKITLTRMILLKVGICLCIYGVLYLMKNSNDIFMNELIHNVKEHVNNDTNLITCASEIYNEINIKIKKFNEYIINLSNKGKEDIVDESNQTTNQEINLEENNVDNQEENSGIGGEENKEVEEDQMVVDARKIKDNYDISLPIVGTVTSRFGPRNGNEIVSSNHAGIDIGASVGTSILSAGNGTVTEKSEEGDYRETFKNC